MRSIIIVILTAIIALSYANDSSVRSIIDGGINFVETTYNNFQQPAADAVETIEDTVDSET